MAKVIKGETRGRPDKWIVDYRDGAGIRRWATFDRKRDADGFYDKVRGQRGQRLRPQVDPNITVKDYAARWLGRVAVQVKTRTHESYADTLRLHLIPRLGGTKVRLLDRMTICALLEDKLRGLQDESGTVVAPALSRNSVRVIHATVRVLLNAAIQDGVILANPADKLGHQLRLVAKPKARQDEIKAFTRPQLEVFLGATRTAQTAYQRRHYPLFFCGARTGLRLGELLALQCPDVDFTSMTIRVERSLARDGRIETPKSGHGRTVAMSAQLARELRRLQIERKAETLKRGRGEVPPWVFCSEAGTPLDESHVRKVFAKVLVAAGLPSHFTPPCLRHTFASLLLQQGESPQYVQEQLGHASLSLTTDTYGRWLPKKPIFGGVNSLDDASESRGGSKVVANAASDDDGVSASA